MGSLLLFNPENDSALACGSEFYTAPANALLLREAGAVLPFWYGNAGDYVIAPLSARDWLGQIKQEFDIKPDFYNEQSSVYENVAVWGWSNAVHHQLLDLGINKDKLPSKETLQHIRELSHRRLTIKVYENLKATLDIKMPETPVEAFTLDEVENYIDTHASCYVKSPWSSSGRGVVGSYIASKAELLRRSKGVIRRQGSIMCEAGLNKVKDFAMLFYSDGKTVKQIGYSDFFIEKDTAYSGNILANDEVIENNLTKYISKQYLIDIALALETIYTELIAPHYKGYFGTDMMIYEDNNKYAIAPCIEVNLRMTMGVVAWIWNNRYMTTGVQGKLKIERGCIDESKLIYKVENGKLLKGKMLLTPPNPNFSISVETDN